MGLLPPEFDIDEIREKVKETYFEPATFLSTVWTAFWELRNTKSYEMPINHTDIYHYTELLRFELEAWEVKAIIGLDRKYYAAYQKHHKD